MREGRGLPCSDGPSSALHVRSSGPGQVLYFSKGIAIQEEDFGVWGCHLAELLPVPRAWTPAASGGVFSFLSRFRCECLFLECQRPLSCDITAAFG